MKKKVISLLLVAVMLIGILPLQAMAAAGDGFIASVKFDVKGGVAEVKATTTGSHGTDKVIYYAIANTTNYNEILSGSTDGLDATIFHNGVSYDADTGAGAPGSFCSGTSAQVTGAQTDVTLANTAGQKLAEKEDTYYLMVWSESATVTTDKVYVETFKTDAKGDLYVPTITMPTGGDLKIGAARDITIALNGVLSDNGTDELANNTDLSAAVTVTGADADGGNSGAIANATVVYVAKTDAAAASIKVTVPVAYMEEANEGKKITVALPSTISWKDDANTTYVASKADDGSAITSSVFTVAADAQQNFAVANDAAATFGDEPITLTTSGGNGDGAVTYAITTDPATGVATLGGTNNDELTITGVGKVTVTATKAGSGTYKTATATKDIVIGKATPNATVTETKVSEAGKKLSEVVTTSAKGVDGNDLPGNFTWTKEDGTPIADITAEDVAEQATYKWTFTPDDDTNYTTKTGSVTPWGESKATVTFEVDTAKGSIPADKATAEVKKNAPFEASFPTVTAKEGFTFKGWVVKGTDTVVDIKTVTVADDTTFVAVFETVERHEAIMLGRANTTLFGPDDNLNRAEAATILSRLYGMYTDEEIFDETKGAAVQHAPIGFTDVNDSAIWYYAAVGFAQNKNLIEGKSATSFAPAAKITRAEFVTMLARLVANTKDVPEVDVSQSQLTGISGHWAENAIVYLELNKGGLNGKVGTDFKPNDNLTRAEAAKMVNAVFGRVQSTSIKEEDQLDADLNLFTDVYRNTWYYNNVIEATVGHKATDPDFRHVK